MKVTKKHRLLWLILLLPPLAFLSVLCNRKAEDDVAVCCCAVVGQASPESGFGNYHSVRQSAEMLLEISKSEEFKVRLAERCMRGLKSQDCYAVSNAVAGVSCVAIHRRDDEWRFSITAKSAQRRISVYVANVCADALREILESENRSLLEKSVSQILANKTKLERRIADLNAEIRHHADSSAESAKAMSVEVDKVREELRLLAGDESFVRSNCLAKCDVLMVVSPAE